MSTRLESALAELVGALREELRVELAEHQAAPPELLSVTEAGRRLGIGRSALYQTLARGELRSVKVGRRRLVPADAIADFVGFKADISRRDSAPDSSRRGSLL